MKLRIIREKQQLRNATSIHTTSGMYTHEKKTNSDKYHVFDHVDMEKKTIFNMFVYPPDCLPASVNQQTKQKIGR